MKSIASVLGIVIFVVVGHVSGPIVQLRVFGMFWVLGVVWLAFQKEVPFSFGPVEVVRLRGWAKAFVILPFLTAGVVMVLYAQELTCWSHKYQHLCAGPAKP